MRVCSRLIWLLHLLFDAVHRAFRSRALRTAYGALGTLAILTTLVIGYLTLTGRLPNGSSGDSRQVPSASATNPTTTTMANGRWESEPMSGDMAAGRRPSVATSMVIMMGRSRRLAPSSAAWRTVRPRTLSWLMYSTMITPVWTETPISARNPRPDDTLKCVPVMRRLRNPPMGERDTMARIRKTHFHELNAE